MDGDRQRYVVIRDDDLHAYTPIECLETLYRPFLDRLQVVNLSAIPCVDTTVKLKNGLCEEYLIFNPEKTLPLAPISANPTLVDYVLQNSGYQITQHGYTHLTHEFLSRDRRDLAGRLDRGLAELSKAGFKDVCTFIAPQERLSTEALKEVSKRFALISSHWYEWRQLPVAWLPWYVVKQWNNIAHWHAGKTNRTKISPVSTLIIPSFHPFSGFLIGQDVAKTRMMKLDFGNLGFESGFDGIGIAVAQSDKFHSI